MALKWPIHVSWGKTFHIRETARDQTGLEHIAEKRHHLRVSDVQQVPHILEKPMDRHRDPQNQHYRNYYGKRKGNRPPRYLKIVTSVIRKKENEELVITVYPTRHIK